MTRTTYKIKTDRHHAVHLLLTGYHKRLIENLPQLQILDGLDRDGRTAVVDEILADIPGLDQYLEYLVSSSSSVGMPLFKDVCVMIKSSEGHEC